MRKLAIIRTSPHRKGNSNLLADRFIEGTKQAGLEIVDIDLNDHTLGYCKGCYGTGSAKSCTVSGTCWQKDDANLLCGLLRDCDTMPL